MTPVWGLSEGERKVTGHDRVVLPRSVIYDPELSRSLPVAVSGASGMNAIAHCVEALWTERANPRTAAVAEEGIRMLSAGLRRIVAEPDGLEGRSEALAGAWLAGTALAEAGTALHHKLCHVLGGLGLPHAEVHAILLPHVTAFNGPAAPAALERIARALGTADAVAGLRELSAELGVPPSLAAVGLRAERVEEVARLVEEAQVRTPRPAGAEDVRGIVERALTGAVPAT
jgi:maleylacetate reductase